MQKFQFINPYLQNFEILRFIEEKFGNFKIYSGKNWKFQDLQWKKLEISKTEGIKLEIYNREKI